METETRTEPCGNPGSEIPFFKSGSKSDQKIRVRNPVSNSDAFNSTGPEDFSSEERVKFISPWGKGLSLSLLGGEG